MPLMSKRITSCVPLYERLAMFLKLADTVQGLTGREKVRRLTGNVHAIVGCQRQEPIDKIFRGVGHVFPSHFCRPASRRQKAATMLRECATFHGGGRAQG